LNPIDGVKICFSVKAMFAGPEIRIVEPTIDFGLLKINST